MKLHTMLCRVILNSVTLCLLGLNTVYAEVNTQEPKLYWFIPDGMRADPKVFNVFQWAERGQLPNIKFMMDHGAYGYSIPTFPSHTPTNFATLFTGTYPAKHGVADGPMHTEGNPLSKASIGGFNSVAKKVDPLWVTLERQYGKDIALLSVPGSTPPELEKGITIRGRWGGWGADFPATNFEALHTGYQQAKQGRGARLFFFGPKLTQYKSTKKRTMFNLGVKSYAPILEVALTQFGTTVHAHIYDSTDNRKIDYDRIAFTLDKKTVITDLKQGEWSDWQPIVLSWMVNYEARPVKTSFKIKVIKLDKDGFYRVRFFYNSINKYVTQPKQIAEEINKGVGPMVDFVDNFPPQLIYYQEDKQTFIEEAQMSLDWHRKAVGFIIDEYKPEILINDIYTPNQMLTSRWWMGYLDPSSSRYEKVTAQKRERLWREVKEMYRGLDQILGELLNRADANTYVILSSDHGAVPLDKWVRLNNLFANKGWLKFIIDPNSGEPTIDWKNSKVIYLKMAHVYIHPDGLGGRWKRASGAVYQKLREKVKKTLLALKDEETGIKPVTAVHDWEDVPQYLNLPMDRVGDLVIVNKAGYGWNEEMTADRSIFDVPYKSGYKQAIMADKAQGMWTPFVIIGPKVKSGYALKQPIRHVDQYPTILHLLDKKIEAHVDGKVLHDIFE